MKKIIILFSIIFILLISCNKENSDIKNNLNEITVSVGPEPQSIDPIINSAIDAMIYTTHLFENLTIKDENGNIIR